MGSDLVLKTIVDDPEKIAGREKALMEMCQETRIPCRTEVVLRQANENVHQLIQHQSLQADLVFLGLGIPDVDAMTVFCDNLSNLIGGIPNCVLVRNAGPFRGELIQAN